MDNSIFWLNFSATGVPFYTLMTNKSKKGKKKTFKTEEKDEVLDPTSRADLPIGNMAPTSLSLLFILLM